MEETVRRHSRLGRVVRSGWPVLLVLVVYLVAGRGELGFSYDSVFYWSAARNVARGGSVETDILHSESLPRFGNPSGLPVEPGEAEGRLRARHPFTTWPPGYPVAIGLLARVVGGVERAALLINLAALAALVLLLGSIGRRLGGPAVGTTTAGIASVLPLVHQVARMFWSEVLFTAIVLAALVAGSRWLQRPRDRLSAFTLASAAAGAVWTRYVGVSLAVVLVLLASIQVRRTPPAARMPVYRLSAGMLVLYGLLVAPLFWRNWRLTGTLSGADRLPVEEGLLSNVIAIARSLVDLLPLLRSALGGPLDTVISGGVLVLAAAVAIAAARRYGRTGAVTGRPDPAAAVPLVMFAVAYVGLVFILRSRTLFDPLNFRMLFPALVCLLPFVGFLLMRATGGRGAGWVLAFLVPYSMAVTLSESVTNEWRSLAGGDRSVVRMRGWAMAELRETPAKQILFSDRVEVLHLATGQPVHWLPSSTSLPVLRSRLTAGELVFVIARPSRHFPCPAFRQAYERHLDHHGRRVIEEPGFTAWVVAPAGADPGPPPPAPDPGICGKP